MSLLDVFQTYILPIGGIIGGMSAVIVFVLNGRQRRAKTDQMNAGTEDLIILRSAKLQKMITETTEKVMSAQNELIEDFRNHLSRSDEEIDKLKKMLALEVGSREEIIRELKMELAKYQEENTQLRADNKRLNEKIAEQQIEIDALKIKIAELDQQYKERTDG